MSNFEVTENIKEFILGGRADFTILQEATDKTVKQQYKYRVTIPKDCTPDNTNVWYVSAELADNCSVESDGKHLKYQGYSTVINYLVKYSQIYLISKIELGLFIFLL